MSTKRKQEVEHEQAKRAKAAPKTLPPSDDEEEDESDEEDDDDEEDGYVSVGTLSLLDNSKTDKFLIVQLTDKQKPRQAGRSHVFKAIFQDKRKEAIAFEVWGEELGNTLHDFLNIDSYYKLSGVGVKTVAEKERKWHPHHLKLAFIDDKTQIFPISNYRFPAYTSLQYLPGIAEIPKLQAAAPSDSSVQVNVVAMVLHYSVFEGVSKAGKQYKKGTVSLCDESMHSIDYVVFGNKSERAYEIGSIVAIRAAEVEPFRTQLTLKNGTIEAVPNDVKYPSDSRVTVVRRFASSSSQDPSAFTNLSQWQRDSNASEANAPRTSISELTAMCSAAKQVLDDARENGLVSEEPRAPGRAPPSLPQDVLSQIKMGNFSIFGRITGVRDTSVQQEAKKTRAIAVELTNKNTLIRPVCADPAHRDRRPKVDQNRGNWVCKDEHSRKDCAYSFMPILSVADETGEIDVHSFSLDGLLPEGVTAVQLLLDTARASCCDDSIQLSEISHVEENDRVLHAVDQLLQRDNKAYIFNIYTKVDYLQKGLQVTLSSVRNVNWAEELAMLERL